MNGGFIRDVERFDSTDIIDEKLLQFPGEFVVDLLGKIRLDQIAPGPDRFVDIEHHTRGEEQWT